MLNCPIPKNEYEKILLAHGGGGKLTQQLIEKVFVSQFDNNLLNELGDSAKINFAETELSFTTDSYVVQPIFFPGGNIGDLAVNGTVNDLAVSGAVPKYLSAGFIIEEGLSIEELWDIVNSMKIAADKAGVKIVTGDTKVVERGKGDKIFINTSGIGEKSKNVSISPLNCNIGDKIILNGSIGDHGIAILSAREGLGFETEILSDTAALNGIINNILTASSNIKMMRDITRGGLTAILNEIACAGELGIKIFEDQIEVKDQVNGACEILGLDPLYIANEGKFIAIVNERDSENVLEVMNEHELGKEARIIGEIVSEHPRIVTMETTIGSERILDMISGEQLPRIC